MPQSSYPYACARISALEKGLLNANMIRRMSESSLDDCMRMLMEARYGQMPDATAADCERMIERELRHAAETVRELSPDPALTDLFLLQTDAQNLKVLIKARLLGQTDSLWQEGGLYSREQLSAMVAEQKYAALPKLFGEAMEALEHKLKIHTEPQLVSVMTDFGYLSHCVDAANDCREPFAKRYFTALCDFDNVITFLRMRAMGAQQEDLKDVMLPAGSISKAALIGAYELSGDSLMRALSGCEEKDALLTGLSAMLASGSISLLEKARDDDLLSLVNSHRHDVLTIFPLIGYYLARQREASAVRLILTVKRNGLDDSVIQERLRKLYG